MIAAPAALLSFMFVWYDACMRKIWVAIFAVIMFSCASTQKSLRDFMNDRNGFDFLPPDALAYIEVDIAHSRSLVDGILTTLKIKGNSVNIILDKSSVLMAGFYPQSPDRKILGVVHGKNYPVSAANLGFSGNKIWEKNISSTGIAYWHSNKPKMSLAVFPSQVFVSDGDPLYAGKSVRLPDNFAKAKKDAAVLLWMPSAVPIRNLLAMLDVPVNIPVNDMFVSVIIPNEAKNAKNETLCQLEIRLDSSSPSLAKALASILRIARSQLKNLQINDPKLVALINLILANAPETDGRSVMLRSPVIEQSVLTGLAGSFLVH
jgi:hypothetical protein